MDISPSTSPPELPSWVFDLPLRPALTASSVASIPSTVCARCPAALWYASAAEMPTAEPALSCHCRAMNVMTWSPTERHHLVDCDEVRLQLIQLEQENLK